MQKQDWTSCGIFNALVPPDIPQNKKLSTGKLKISCWGVYSTILLYSMRLTHSVLEELFLRCGVPEPVTTINGRLSQIKQEKVVISISV